MSHKEDFFNSCIVIDTETTGKDYREAEVIETGFALRNGNSWDIFNELHKPQSGNIPPMVSSICYIDNNMVKNKETFGANKETFQTVVDKYKDGYAVGHNYFYDMKVLEREGIVLPENSICTWRMAKNLLNGIDEIENTTLPYLRFALNLDVPIDMYCHRAGNDSFMTAKLLEAFILMMEYKGIIDPGIPYGPQITQWLSLPIIFDRMPFGKHKGELLTKVPTSYWVWALKNMDSLNEESENYDKDLAASIEKALGVV